jgi:hypothetical protein
MQQTACKIHISWHCPFNAAHLAKTWEIPLHLWIWWMLLKTQHTVSLHVVADKTLIFTPHFHETQKTMWQCAVKNTMPREPVRFWRQLQAKLHAFGKKADWSKSSNIIANLRQNLEDFMNPVLVNF